MCDAGLRRRYPGTGGETPKMNSLQKQGEFSGFAGKGLVAFDAWLDNRWEHPGILVAVTFSLPAQPNVNDADAITLVVLSNRKAIGYPDAVCLHRPEKGLEHTLGKTLQRAILWAGKSSEALNAGWHTGPITSRGARGIKPAKITE